MVVTVGLTPDNPCVGITGEFGLNHTCESLFCKQQGWKNDLKKYETSQNNVNKNLHCTSSASKSLSVTFHSVVLFYPPFIVISVLVCNGY